MTEIGFGGAGAETGFSIGAIGFTSASEGLLAIAAAAGAGAGFG